MRLTRCPTHAKIIDTAREEMAKDQRFMKESVLEKAGFSEYGHLIQWPFVRAAIEHDLGDEVLQPVPYTNGEWLPDVHPEKFIPGARRPTAGYARASSLDPAVAQTYARRRFNNTVGVMASFERLVTSYQKQGVALNYTPGSQPRLLPSAPPAE